MRTGLYGGTFDPIHHGHLILAREATEQFSLDRIVFIPASQSPHKSAAPCAPSELRLLMVREAIAEEARFECDASEILKAGVSYTIDTVHEWKRRAPNDELLCIIGDDNVTDLATWRNIEILETLVKFVVFGRSKAESTHTYPRITRKIDISATEVRMRVAAGRSIRYLVPESVRSIIESHQLYKGGLSLTQNS